MLVITLNCEQSKGRDVLWSSLGPRSLAQSSCPVDGVFTQLNWNSLSLLSFKQKPKILWKFTPQGRGLGLMRPRLELGEKSHWWDPCLFPAGLWESRARPGRTLAGNVITLASRRGDSRFSHIRTSCSEWVPGSERYLGFKGNEASFKIS